MKDNNIRINFNRFPFCFRCVETDSFTNKLKNYDSFFVKFKQFFEIDVIHICQCNYDEIFIKTNKHSHSINIQTKEFELVMETVKQLLKSWKPSYKDRDNQLFFENNINDYVLWQLGCTAGTRIIGLRQANEFFALFFDYHHLIYPDKNHNQEDYYSYSFCPITYNEMEDS